MDMDTKDKLEKLDEKVEQMKIEQREMRMEIIILLESLKANGPIASSSPQVESAQLPSERLETRIPIPPEQPSEERPASLSTSTQLQALSQQNRPVILDFWYVVYSFKSSLNLFISYLKMKLGVDVEDYRLGSLVLTVSCSSLEVLEALWKEYRTGHLNKVVQATLVTAEVLEKLDLNEVKLRTLISEEDYLSYKDFLNYRPGKTETKTSQGPAVFAFKPPGGKGKMTISQVQGSPAMELVEGKTETKSSQEPAVFASKLPAAKAKVLGTRSQKTTPVSCSLLRDLAVDLGTKWRELGKILGLAYSLLDYFDTLDLSLSDKGNAMLVEWKRLNGDDATMEVLQEALTKIDMGHLMEKVAGTTVSTTSRAVPTLAEFYARLDYGKPSQVVKGDYIARSGYVLIINNDPTHTASYLFKSEKQAFAERFGFTTREDIYLTTSDMLKALTDTAQRDFSNNDCFCCIIRSTGTEHGICGIDDKPIDIKTITSLFTSDKCPSLDGKPKIFVLIPKKFKHKPPVRRGMFGYVTQSAQFPPPEDVEARSMLRHLVISEKDFLVWNCFGEVPSSSYRSSYILGCDWLECLLEGMHLREAIAAVADSRLGIVERSSLLSTLEKKVFFERKDSPYTVVQSTLQPSLVKKKGSLTGSSRLWKNITK
ncbi:Caspase-7 [Porites harrisoni]